MHISDSPTTIRVMTRLKRSGKHKPLAAPRFPWLRTRTRYLPTTSTFPSHYPIIQRTTPDLHTALVESVVAIIACSDRSWIRMAFTSYCSANAPSLVFKYSRAPTPAYAKVHVHISISKSYTFQNIRTVSKLEEYRHRAAPALDYSNRLLQTSWAGKASPRHRNERTGVAPGRPTHTTPQRTPHCQSVNDVYRASYGEAHTYFFLQQSNLHKAGALRVLEVRTRKTLE
ncbi:uncharacterized protein H6S33_009148 [Morchella sextelata]|uniref:uncharacterized protein n=1 Tax=Morchella sextelata TaxID=1174677 RepID=UPI001D03F56F|nr:uncharacterized protein H6S33_009148 [Morchella sextelata]KAH0612768.1 hypothetical protein H6S33_009148 [Morchella sextelata]